MMKRTVCLAAICGLFVACGTSDPPNNGPVDTGADTGADATSDTTVDDTGQDTLDLDVEADTVEDTADTTNGLALGDDCDLDTDCSSGNCLRIDPALEQGLCTDRCNDTEDCLDEWECLSVASSGGDFEEWCVPVGLCVDVDGDGYGIGPGCAGPDCNDADAMTNPAADETCDAVDNDCDNQIDENPVGTNDDCDTGFLGECAPGRTTCVAGTMTCSSRTAVADEVCDGLDNDCDGTNDESVDGAALTEVCYDGPAGTSGVGTCVGGTRTCTEGAFAGCVGQVLPSAEVCDMADNDCDTFRDEVDEDGDGAFACAGAGQDCDDTDPLVYPGATELCNEIDDNCNGLTDEFAEDTYYRDVDGDGVGNSLTSVESCGAPMGYVAEGGDCNDNNDEIYPGAPELCNEVDDDCDARNDEGLVEVNIYRDLDGDGYGSTSSAALQSCLEDTTGDGVGDTAPAGYSPDNTDCNDSAAGVYPGATELCDGILNDCRAPVADWICPTVCAGNWPVAVNGAGGFPLVAQMDADAEREVVYSMNGNTGVLNHDGSVVWQMPGGGVYSNPNLARFGSDDVYMDVAVQLGNQVRIFNGTDGATLATIPVNGTSYRGIGVTDIDGNGVPDIASGAGTTISLLNPDLSVLSTLTNATVDGDAFGQTGALIYDFDGDGVAEVTRSSGIYTCAGTPSSCRGRLYVHDIAGGTFNDPTWMAADVPHFQPTCAPNCYGSTGYPPMVLDVDGDGALELSASFTDATTGEVEYMWALDGTEHALSGTTTMHFPAPVGADWRINPTGALREMNGPVVDMDGDGTYEVIRQVGSTLTIVQEGTALADSALPLGGSAIIADLDRDNRLEVLFMSTNNSINCYEFGAQTYDDSRILNYGGYDVLSQGPLSNSSYDPYEPNNRTDIVFDAATTLDPIGDSRALSLTPFLDRFENSNNQWRRVARGIIGSSDDVDFYVLRGGAIGVYLTDLVRNLDLTVHVFTAAGVYLESIDSSNGGASTEQVTCNPNIDDCAPGTKMFIIEVRPSDPAVDYGPFMYSLTTVFAY